MKFSIVRGPCIIVHTYDNTVVLKIIQESRKLKRNKISANIKLQLPFNLTERINSSTEFVGKQRN